MKGENGVVREVRAILDFNSPYCVMLSRDGLALGRSEAVLRPLDWQKTHPDKVPFILDFRGIERSILIKVPEISLGPLVARDVDAIVIDLDFQRLLPIDLILGRSFLANFRLVLDGAKGYLSLTEPRPRAARDPR